MKYVVHRRFKRKGIGGEFNLPHGTECEEVEGVICYQGCPVCLNTSQVAKEFFACNNDGCGLQRGELTHSIAFGVPLTELQKNIARDTPSINQYIQDDSRVILFNDSFFHASILELLSVKTKLGGK